MAETAQDFEIYQQDDCNVDVTVTDSAGAAKNIVGATIQWVLFTRAGDTITRALSKSVGSGITITGGSSGIFRIAITSAESAALAEGRYHHQAEVLDASNVKKVVCEGTVIVKKNATT